MKYVITVLLSVALIWGIQQETPVNKSFADTASHKVTVAAKPPTAPKTSQVQPVEIPPPLTAHEELMSQAGIDQNDWAAVDYIVSRESNWNQLAINASSGSCGLVQELPCGKSGCRLGDGVCQLRWASQYATQRYGSWWGAHSWWQQNQWW